MWYIMVAIKINHFNNWKSELRNSKKYSISVLRYNCPSFLLLNIFRNIFVFASNKNKREKYSNLEYEYYMQAFLLHLRVRILYCWGGPSGRAWVCNGSFIRYTILRICAIRKNILYL